MQIETLTTFSSPTWYYSKEDSVNKATASRVAQMGQFIVKFRVSCVLFFYRQDKQMYAMHCAGKPCSSM